MNFRRLGLALSTVVVSGLSIAPFAWAGVWQEEVERLEKLPRNHVTEAMLREARRRAEEEAEEEEPNQPDPQVMASPECQGGLILC